MRGAVALEPPVTRWYCPSCGAQDVTRQFGVHTRFHNCAGLRGLSAPMVPAGTKAKHVVNVREDYEGGQLAQRDEDGRALMNIVTVRDDGQDCTVLAPTANVNAN